MNEHTAESDDGRRAFPTGVVAAVVFVVALLLLLVLLRDEDGDVTPLADRVETGAIPEAERDIAGRLDALTLRPTRAIRVRARRVAWSDGPGGVDGPWLQAPVVTFTVEVEAAMGGRVVLSAGRIESPELRLVQAPGGTWNYESVLDPLLAGDASSGRNGDGAGGVSARMRNVGIRDGRVTIQLPDATYRIRELDADVETARLSGPDVTDPTFDLSRASATLELPDTADGTVVRAVALEDARLRLADGALAFEVDRGSFGTSTFADARGVWDPALGGYGVNVRMRVTDGRLADLPWLKAEVPEDVAGSFDLSLEALSGDRTAVALSDLAMETGGSSATGSLRAIFGPTGVALESVDMRVDPLALDLVEAFTGPLPYGGELRGTLAGTGGDIRFDLDARLTTSPAATPFNTNVTGAVAFTEAGPEFRDVSARLDAVPLDALEAFAPGLPLRGSVTGTVSLDGAPGSTPLRLNVRLEAGGGIVAVAGIVDLSGAVPSYDVEGTLTGVELRQVLQPAAPPAQVHARFDLEGTGTDPATAVADLSLDGSFTGWRSEPGDTITARVSVDRGRLDARSVRLSLGPIQAAAGGEWRFAGGSGGQVAYELVVESLEPLGPYLPPDASGRHLFTRGELRARGTVAGTLETPILEGSVETESFRFGEWAADRFEGEYAARLDGGLPIVEGNFSGDEIRTPAGDFDQATVELDFTRPAFELAVRADRDGDLGVLEIDAAGRIEETGEREIQLRRAEVDLEEQRWRLPSPATIAWTAGDAVRVDGLRLEQTGGQGLIQLSGVVAPFDQTDVRFDVVDLPVGDVARLLAADLPLSGRASVEGSVRGPAGSPQVDITLALADGAIRDVPVTRLSSRIEFRDRTLSLEGTALLGDSARFEVDGSMPVALELGMPPSLEFLEDGRISGRVVTDDFPLATLDPGIASVKDLVGRVQADLRVAGTISAPDLSGGFSLTDGAVTVPLLDQRYERIEGRAVLEGRTLRVEELVARSDSVARVTGEIRFDELTNPTLDLTTELAGFRPQGVDDQEDAAVWGTLRIGGTARTPRLSGDVRVDDGTVDVAFLQQGPGFGEQLVGVAESFEAAFPEFDVEDTSQGFRIVGLTVRAGSDVWFQAEEARAQLQGILTVDKRGSETSIQGTLEGQQGTFNLRVGPVTRRFEVVDASIRFFGSPDPNPGLDITAARVIRTADRGDIEVRAIVSGTLNNPSLALATAEGTTIPEAEALNFLVFGRSSTSLGEISPLGGGGQAFVDALAFAGVADYFSAQIADETGLGLDYFQIQMQPGGAQRGTELFLLLGEEVLDEIFLLFQLPLTEFSELWAVSGEWRIDREWTLEAALEPPDRQLGLPAPQRLPFDTDQQHQFFTAIRWRWTY